MLINARSEMVKSFASASFLLAMFTGLLYFLGLSFYGGYIKEWGLDERLIPLSLENILVHGIHAMISVGLPPLGALFLFIIGMLLLSVLVSLLLSLGAIRSIPSEICKRFPKRKDFDPAAFNVVIEKLAPVMLSLGWVLVIVVTFSFSVEASANRGAEYARSQMEAFESMRPMHFQLSDDHLQPIDGHVIQCSGDHCAIYTKGNSIIIAVSSIARVSSAPKGALSQSASKSD